MFDVFVPDHNRYLKGTISQIRQEGMREDLVHSLYVELKFTSMLSPNYRGAPICLKRDGKHYMLLYSELDDLTGHFPHWSHAYYPLKWYLGLLKYPIFYFIEDGSSDIRPAGDFTLADGIILRFSEDDEFTLEGELLRGLYEFLRIDLCSAEELRDLFENHDNSRLENLLSQNPKDWDEIIREIGNSVIFALMDVRADLEDEEFEMFFNCFSKDPFGFNKEISVSTAKSIGNQYAIIVSFKKAVDHVLNFGLTGLKVYTSYGSEYMSRDLLVEKYELIERHCTDERLAQAHECLFKL
jgi:hypothetical protein